MEEAPENGKESSHSAHAEGMNEWEGRSAEYMYIVHVCALKNVVNVTDKSTNAHL